MPKSRMDLLRAEMEIRRRKEMRSRRLLLLAGLCLLAFFLARFLYQAFAPKPVIPPRPYQVRVADGGDEGVPQARLTFFRPRPLEDPTSFEGRSDAQGRWRIPKKHWNGDWICQARTHRGLVSQGYVADLDPELGSVEMAPAERIVGRVEDKKGRALVAARILVRHRMKAGPPLLEVESDERGGFVLDGISSSLKILNFQVLLEGFQRSDFEVDLHGAEELILRVGRSLPILLEVRLPDGSPAADLAVELAGQDLPTVRTDPEGRAGFTGLRPGKSYRPRVHHPRLTYLVPPAVKPSKKPLLVQLQEPRALEAFARDRAGNILADLEILHYHGPWVRSSTRTDHKGFFRLERLPLGKIRLHYRGPDQDSRVFELILREDTDKPILKLW